MHDCMKRRLLYAASQAYHPRMETVRRAVGWKAKPVTVERRDVFGQRPIDLALVGEVREGVVVAFRGSLPPFFGGKHDDWTVLLDWLNNGASVCRADPDYGGAGVHLGFSQSTARLWEDSAEGPGIRSTIDALFADGARRHVFVTGHSKGGALANLFALRAARRAAWHDAPISVATIAAARAGGRAFADAYAAERIACLRYELPGDPIPHLPLGPQSPRWVRALMRQAFPELTQCDYRPVGERVAPTAATGGGEPGWLAALAGLRLDRLTPALIGAHAICPESGYDRLICLGEAGGCTHGRDHGPAGPPPRRREREGTRSTVPTHRRDGRRRREAPQPTLPDDAREGGSARAHSGA